MLPIWNKYDYYSSGSIILEKKNETWKNIAVASSLGYMYCR